MAKLQYRDSVNKFHSDKKLQNVAALSFQLTAKAAPLAGTLHELTTLGKVLENADKREDPMFGLLVERLTGVIFMW